MTSSFWRGKRVLVTGHTGFKGAWLTLWLRDLGAEVAGLALEPESEPTLFGLAGLERDGASHIADIADRAAVADIVGSFCPQIVFHLAAQALVRRSYADPVETFSANVLGTVTLLDALRAVDELEAAVVVTSDKCYENREWIWGYRENDPLGGHDPYSASKGAAEIAAIAMRRSFFAPGGQGSNRAGIATARAGNVIGGGDFADDRLVPDIVRGCLGPDGRTALRNPGAVRPWQHVLEPLRGYLMLAERLAAGDETAADGWNFGPDNDDNRSVAEVANAIVAALGTGEAVAQTDSNAPHEAGLLRLDCTKARLALGWRPAIGFADTIALTADWYKAWREGADMRAVTLQQIRDYQQTAFQGAAV